MLEITTVKLSRKVKKDIKKLPIPIVIKLATWIEAVQKDGLTEIRKISGYHDEPLQGIRFGQRSIRLNRSYRAIYVIRKNVRIDFLEVLEVNKHDY